MNKAIIKSSLIAALLATGVGVSSSFAKDLARKPDLSPVASAPNAPTAKPAQSPEVLSFQKAADGLILKMQRGVMKVQVWNDRVIRIVYTPGDSLPATESFSVISKPQKVKWTFRESEGELVVGTPSMQARINRQSGSVGYYSSEGKLILQEAADGGKSVTPSKVAGKPTMQVKQAFCLAPDEAIYGLGQHQKGLMNYRGNTIRLQQINTLVGVPVMLSSRGYGILWDNPAVTDVAVGSGAKDQLLWSSEAGEAIDYYFMYGPKPDEVIADYRWLTGEVPMFGKWAFGYWQCKEHYHTQSELLGVLAEYRRRKIPLDGIIQDWFYWEPAPWGSHQFDPKRYPDPTAMVKAVHDQNAHIIISVWAKFAAGSENYNELDKAGVLYAPVYSFMNRPTRFYDPFSPKGREIYWSQMNRDLFARGFDGWWLDATEVELGCKWGEFRDVPTAAGPGFKVYNAYPLKTTQAVYEGQRKASSDKRAFILTRSAFAGQQRNAAVTWSGDIGSDWGTFKRQIPAGLNFVASGIPYWNTDIGGFHSRSPKDPDYQECFTRWFQFGSFCPMFRVHGTGANKSMWDFGSQIEPILIKYDHLRYRLLPYIYSLAWMVTHENYTMMRPLVMDFPADTNVHAIGDQFLFGPAFMVNPVTEPVGTSNVVIPGASFADKDGKPGGLSATYYQGRAFEEKKLERRDEFLAFKWDKVKNVGFGDNFQRDPLPGMTMNGFSARWEGFVLSQTAGDYSFQLRADDGMRLWVDGQLVIEDWKSRPVALHTAKVKLPANAKVPIKIEYYQDKNDAEIELRWKLPEAQDPAEYTRKVYLPEGTWSNFWTGEKVSGGKEISTPAPLETVPLFVRAGSIVPMGPLVQYAAEKAADPIELRVYPGADGKFTLYEDEGDNYNYEKGVHATIPFTWNNSTQTLTLGKREGSFPGMLKERTFRVVLVRPSHGAGIEPCEAPEQIVKYNGSKCAVLLGRQ